jgi:alpha-glucosidase
VLDEYDDRMMVAEAWVLADRRPRYLRAGEYHQAFDFDLLTAPWDAGQFATIIESAVDAAGAVGSSPTWVLSNHDVVRHPTRYGLPADVVPQRWLLDGPHEALDTVVGDRRARAAAMLTLALPGSTYVYMGDELGLPEVWDLPADVLDDPVWEQSGHTRKGRDGCRVPIPWESTGPSFGFGAGPGWLPQPASFGALSAAAQEDDPDSMLHLYREAIGIRRRRSHDGGVEVSRTGDVVSLTRADGFRCVLNMGAAPVAMPCGTVLLASGDLPSGELPSDTAVWFE